MTSQEANDAQRAQLLRDSDLEGLYIAQAGLMPLAAIGSKRALAELIEVQDEIKRRLS